MHLPTSNIAFKEWAIVCAALQTGRQVVVVRKGGINEGRDCFRVKHDNFWLLPTRFHQQPGAVADDATTLWSVVESLAPPPGKFRLDLYAQVQTVFELREEAQLARIAQHQILSLETLRERYFYRQPGLFVLTLRVWQVPTPHIIDDTPYIAGCKSWVELPQPLQAANARALLDDASFAEKLSRLHSSLDQDGRAG